MNRGGQSLEQLDGTSWGAPTYDSRLVQEVHRLRRVPIEDLTVEDLRLLLSQQVGAQWLMPRALAILLADPFAEGDMYPGDLLSAVLMAEADYWTAHPKELDALWRVRSTLQSIRSDIEELLAKDGWPSFG